MTEIKSNIAGIGNVQIADEVIAVIAGTACMEVEGVGAPRNITGVADMLGRKNLAKGVAVSVDNGNVSIEISVYIKYGYKIQEVSLNVQKRVKTAIETMTGLNVMETNINVTGLYFDKSRENS